ncbi:SDR family NAD(P)-dependent oxidoreductase [Paenibacillus sp. strain BS8-2]
MRDYTLLERLLFPRASLDKKKLKHALEGKTVLITGASSGIGEQLAYLLGHYKVHLILTGRNVIKLREIACQITGKDPIGVWTGEGETYTTSTGDSMMHRSMRAVSIFGADLRNEGQLSALLAFVDRLGLTLDVFVSNAGLSIRRSIMDSLDRPHDFARTMAINYTAPVTLLLALIPQLQQSSGQMINVSTINASLIPFPKWAAYQASKSAFDVWLRSAAPELNANGIATTSVYLPLVRTPMIEPTKQYAKMPAMNAEHAAELIAKSIYTRRMRIRPWWMPVCEWASLWGRGLWERIAPASFRAKEKR